MISMEFSWRLVALDVKYDTRIPPVVVPLFDHHIVIGDRFYFGPYLVPRQVELLRSGKRKKFVLRNLLDLEMREYEPFGQEQEVQFREPFEQELFLIGSLQPDFALFGWTGFPRFDQQTEHTGGGKFKKPVQRSRPDLDPEITRVVELSESVSLFSVIFHPSTISTNRMRAQTGILLGLLIVIGSAPHASFSQSDPLSISWGVVDNLAGGARYFRSSLTIRNEGSEVMDDNWALYFNFIRRIDPDSVRGPVQIRLINGSFYELIPDDDLEIPPGDSIEIGLIASNWVIRESAAPSGFYLIRDGGPALPIEDVEIRPFLSKRQVHRHPNDRLPLSTPITRFEANMRVTLLEDGAFSPIIPTPRSLKAGSAALRLASPISITADSAGRLEAEYLVDLLDRLFGLKSTVIGPGIPAQIALTVSPNEPLLASCGSAEAYSLAADSGGIRITGRDRAGLFYGIQSLVGLIDPEFLGGDGSPVDVPHTRIEDCPRFRYRGLMIDVARHFHPVERIKKTIRFMAFYKLNRLHLHLTDDEGWRLPVGGLPELTDVGARRGHTLDSREHLPPSFGSGPDPDTSPGSGHYTREEFVDLLRFATARHIRVIPEIDAPGHMRAGVKAMENRYRRLIKEGREEEARRFLLTDLDDRSVYRSVQGWDDNVTNVCLESTFLFFETVVEELIGLFAEADSPLEVVNLGGDEVPEGVWEKSPVCRALLASSNELIDTRDLSRRFFDRMVSYLQARGLKTAGWEEIGLGTRTDGTFEPEKPKPNLAGAVVPYAWNSVWGWGGEERAYLLANAGYEVVMANAPNLYFDLAYEKHPKEPGFAWAGFVDARKTFEMTPLNIYNSAYEDLFGNPIDMDEYWDHTRLNPDGRRNILGIQGQLWGENTPSRARFEYLLYPKMLALAERAWSPRPEWSKVEYRTERTAQLDEDWNRFANSLGQREFRRLAHMHGGVAYRIPPPGARIAGGVLESNVAYPGLEIRYTTNASEPNIESPRWRHPVSVLDSAAVRIRAFDSMGRGSRIVRP